MDFNVGDHVFIPHIPRPNQTTPSWIPAMDDMICTELVVRRKVYSEGYLEVHWAHSSWHLDPSWVLRYCFAK